MSMTVLSGMGRLGAHRGGQAEAHRAEAAAGDPVPRRVEVEVLGRPHLVLADAGGDDRVVELAAVAEDLPQPLDGVLRQDGVVAVGEAQRLRLAPLLDLPDPVGDSGRRAAGRPCSSSSSIAIRSCERVADVADDRARGRPCSC